MPSWKKVIISGSDAALNSLTVTNGITGSLYGTASWAQHALTSSYSFNPTISGSISQVDYIDFNTGSATPAHRNGRIFWDNTEGALSVYNSEADVTMQLGQENWTRVYNDTGATITNGHVVRITGTHGDHPEVVLAQSIQVSGSSNLVNQVLGVATHNIEAGTFGYVTTQGLVRGLNTSAYNDGDTLYVSSSAGLLTATPPPAPYEVMPVAQVVKASPGGSGIIYIAVQQPMDFADLSSVDRTSGAYSDGDLWAFHGPSKTWKHTNQLSGSYGLTGSLNVQGSITGSLFGTASFAVSSSRAVTASYAISASYAPNNGYVTIAGSQTITGTKTFTTPNYTVFQNSDSVQVKFTDGTGELYTGATATAGRVASKGPLYLITNYSTNTAPSLVVTTAGDITIGKTSANAKLDVSGSAIISGSLTATGTVSGSTIYSSQHVEAAVNLKSLFSSGDEGGEIFLSKAATNTTIVDGVTIDINRNKLRIFENGGTNRGGYYDITALGAGVGTNLLGGSGTVTQVDTAGNVNGITLTGGPITGTGTVTLGGTLSGIGNSQLTNSSITVGSTSISLGSSATTIAGLSSVTSTSFTGSLLGNASTATSASYATTASYVGSLSANITNNTNNYVLTATGGSNINGESNLTFTGTLLTVSGSDDTAGTGVLEIVTSGGTNLKLGGDTTYSWIQSHASKPLYINQLGNNVILNSGGGSVGIGTTNPSTALHIAKAAATAPIVRLQTTDSTTNGSIQWANSGNNVFAFIGSNTNVSDSSGNLEFATGGTTTRMLINSTGYVGIGTTSPSANLQVNGSNSNGIIQAYVTGGGGNALRLDTNFSGANTIDLNPYISGVSNGGFEISQNGTQRFVISSVGNIGIGTTGPGSKLTVQGNISVRNSSGFDRTTIGIDAISSSPFVTLMRDSDTTVTVRLDSNGDSYFTGGNLGIGTTTPGAKLEVASSTSGTTLLVGRATGNSSIKALSDGGGYLALDSTGAPLILNHYSTDSIWMVTGGGSVGINTTSPSQKLHVSGSARIEGALYDSSNSAGTSGQVLSSTATGIDWVSLSEISGVDGSGTTNYITKWTDADTIGNSIMFESSSRIGIGTTSPSTKLHVSGAGAFGGVIYPDYNTDTGTYIDGATANQLKLYADSYLVGFVGGSERYACSTSQFYTSNSTSISSGDRLYITTVDNAASDTDKFLVLNGTEVEYRTGTQLLSDIGAQAALTNPVTGTGVNQRVALWSGTTTLTSDADLVFDGTNLGIGTTSPAVASGYSTATLDGTTGTFTEYRQNGTALFRIGADGSRPFLYGMTNASMDFFTNTSLKMRLTSGGTLLIGDTVTPAENPWYGTAVFGKNGTNKIIAGYLASSTNGAVIGGHNSALTAWARLNVAGSELSFNIDESPVIFVDSSSKVGIGTTSPTEKVDIRGGVVRISNASNDSGILAFGNYTNGAGYYDNGIFRSALNTIGTAGNTLHIGSYEALAFTTSAAALGSQSVRMYIDGTTGNVGIGTTSPASGNKLEVNGRAFTNQLQYTRAIDISSGNLNDYTTAGFYNGVGMTNAPNSGWFWVTVERYTADAGWCHQTATTFGSGNTANEVYTRVNAGGSWTAWKELTSNTGTVTGTGVDNRVALWSGTTSQDSDANLTWNGTTFNVGGTLTATVKSFIIDHPTKQGKKLQYGVLEGPEHSVYVRGKLTNNSTITLPDHWTGLVHEDTITVNLTPIGKRQDLWVETVTDTTITVGSDNEINCFYTVFAERKDIEKLVTEFDK